MPVTPSFNRDEVRALLGLVGTALRSSPWAVAGFVVFQLASVFTSLAQPALNAAIIDDGILRGDVGTIKFVGLIMVAVAVVNLVVAIGATYFASHVSAVAARDLRSRLNGRIGALTNQQVARLGLSSLLTRSTGDVGQIQGFLFIGLTIVVTAPLMLFGALVLSLSQAWQMAPVILVAGLLLVALIGTLVRRLLPWAALMQRRLDVVNRVLREQLRGIAVIRTFRREDRERARFAAENDELTHVALRLGRTQVLMLPTVTAVSNLAAVAVAALGAVYVDRGQMQIGQITAAVGYLGQILLAVSMLTVIAGVIPRAVTSAGRIGEVLDTEVLESGDADPATPSPAPALVFESVSVGYPGAEAPAIDGISLTCAAGSVTGVLGGTGSGKSTLLSLPLRFADPDAGVVRWDGADVTGLAPAWVRARSAFTGQGAALVTGTIAENLRLGRPDATDAELWEALEVAAADDFVAARQGGLAASVAQEGRNFSGGQRQRLALARAVLRRPSLYVLDDPFSALDVDTEQRIIANLRLAHPESTILIAAQRVSSVRHADVIGVLEDGRLVAVGTDETLRTDSEIYREIAHAQAVTNA
ncbi:MULTISPECIES: ABC transporter ATP-binding protein [Gordonia]|uniref:ABC transporter ATP-binding protein n=1 Tax=Gordonia amicalis TaxID=89053 RepID=A0AAE4UAU4_9ACTN|nr:MULTISPECIES: ABC transporter ATP-binding protein [Gordonia]ATD69451.1 ABC transporter ATP-binding protein [Gordonia sp. 1D]MBA5846909.1 ABC transporter ATP-binding protein [Gordonia amicalis]MCZ4579950.1 ABC transporter ATP-binding protein [Gordonia amicalis]MDJ0451814.1 ABC transporter ATP-binding protein [Gordonia amicalis]MDV6309884.1 ABC transporter ATP-binding protein [Gordonia amicalis]